jgi:hypothetical protein
MSRSLSNLRRGLLGIAFVGSLGFGVTQAFASPKRADVKYCAPYGAPYYSDYCGAGCFGNIGYCAEDAQCRCGLIP